MRLRLSLAVLAAVALAGCAASGGAKSPAASPAPSASAGGAVELTIFAAASLKDAVGAAKEAYQGAHPGTTITVSTDSSAALAAQIEQGAPADVFLSADTVNPRKLVDGGFASGGPVVFAGNELAIIVPPGNPGKVHTPADLARPGVSIIAAAEAVPITLYAQQLVANLAKEPGYPPGFASAYAANVASKEDNVKAVVAKIELGEGDAAIVYATDAAASTTVETVSVPAGANVTATYEGLAVGTSRHPDPSRAFLSWLAGSPGRAILARFGFLPPPA